MRVSYSHWGMIEIPPGLFLRWYVGALRLPLIYQMASN